MKSALNIDMFFFHALGNSVEMIQVNNNQIFHTFRSAREESIDRIPYVIVTSDEATCSEPNDDEGFSQLDQATCSVLCVAGKPAELARLTKAVLDAVEEAYEARIWEEHEDWDFEIRTITPSAGPIEADPDKPCRFRWLHFACDVC